MKLEQLRQYYRKAEEIAGFRTEYNLDGWERKVAPESFDVKVGHGVFLSREATLIVGSKDFFGSDEQKLQFLYRQVSKNRDYYGLSVLLPEIFRYVDEIPRSDMLFIVQARPAGRQFLNRLPRANRRQKKIIAELFWETSDNFRRLSSLDEGVAITIRNNQNSFPEFFLSRLDKWLEKGRANEDKKQRKENEELAAKIKQWLKSECILKINCLPMEFSFKFFGKDFIFDGEKNFLFYHFNPAIAVLPRYYGAAYFVWNVLMYAYNQSPSWVVDQVEDWRKAFESAAPYHPPSLRGEFYTGFYLMLLERSVGALLVDIALGLSPLDRFPDRRRQLFQTRSRKNFLAILNRCSSVLSLENPIKF